MPHTASEWDERYRTAADDEPGEPAEILRECVPLLPQGSALDLACGTGRNALFLAALGQRVTAVDFSSVALEVLIRRAKAAGHTVLQSSAVTTHQALRGTIQVVRADLEQLTLPTNSFDLILCFQYLQRSLLPAMGTALRPGGVLLLETYTRAQQGFSGGPRNPEYLLAPGELRGAFPSLHVVFYRELQAGKGIATLLAQRPAA